jgi:hypothetical protein
LDENEKERSAVSENPRGKLKVGETENETTVAMAENGEELLCDSGERRAPDEKADGRNGWLRQSAEGGEESARLNPMRSVTGAAVDGPTDDGAGITEPASTGGQNEKSIEGQRDKVGRKIAAIELSKADKPSSASVWQKRGVKTIKEEEDGRKK